MNPWYRTVTPRKEVREGRSFQAEQAANVLATVCTENGKEEGLFVAVQATTAR